jgi:hypothetical protein
MDATAFLARLKASHEYRGQIAAVRCIEAKPAEHGTPSRALPDRLTVLLRAEGVERLYSH